jgi:uncharacterized membrane protein YkoI
MYVAKRSRRRQSRSSLPALLLYLFAVAPTLADGRADIISATEEAKGVSSRGIKGEIERRELELFRGAEISLRRAVTIAVERHSGSRAVDISFDGASGSPVYRVKTSKGARISEDTIDARTGEIVGVAIESDARDLQIEDRNNLVALKAVRLDISDAIPVAERNAPGRAISAGLTNDNGKLNFLIVVVSGNELKQVILEPPAAKGRRNRH